MIQEKVGQVRYQAETIDFCKEVPCAALSGSETTQAISLVLRMGVPASYISPRLSGYDTIVMNFKAKKLLAFQLVQQFAIGEAVYVYFGPAFSTGGALLPLYGWYIKALSRKLPGKNIYILAEIQNPNMLMIMHGLFGEFGYSFISKNIPTGILDSVPVFCRQYNHIGTYNPGNFTTNAACSLFKGSTGNRTLTDLMAKNQIDLAKGDNLLFAASIPAAATERRAVLQQVQAGIETVRSWGKFKNAFLNSLTNCGE